MGYSKFHKFVLIWCSNFGFCVLILCFFAYKISITTKLVESVSTRMTLVIHRLAEVRERVIYKSLHKRKPPLSFVYSFKFLPEAPHGFGHFFLFLKNSIRDRIKSVIKLRSPHEENQISFFCIISQCIFVFVCFSLQE